jgi:DNA-binding transcriptional regulator YiaG
MITTSTERISDSEALIDLIEARRLASSGEAYAIRVACGLSLKDIGDAIGRTPTSVRLWERGRTVPYGAAARRYAKLLAELRDHFNESRPPAGIGGLDEDDRAGGRHVPV